MFGSSRTGKAPERQGKVQLIDASSFWAPMRSEPRRQAPPDNTGEGGGHPEAPRRLPGWRHSRPHEGQ